MEQMTYYWVCPRCKKQYETPQPIPIVSTHYICPECYYAHGNSQVNQCAPVVTNERKERLWD